MCQERMGDTGDGRPSYILLEWVGLVTSLLIVVQQTRHRLAAPQGPTARRLPPIVHCSVKGLQASFQIGPGVAEWRSLPGEFPENGHPKSLDENDRSME